MLQIFYTTLFLFIFAAAWLAGGVPGERLRSVLDPDPGPLPDRHGALPAGEPLQRQAVHPDREVQICLPAAGRQSQGGNLCLPSGNLGPDCRGTGGG